MAQRAEKTERIHSKQTRPSRRYSKKMTVEELMQKKNMKSRSNGGENKQGKAKATVFAKENSLRDRLKRLYAPIAMWFDSESYAETLSNSTKIQWGRTFPFIALHLSVFAVFYVGWSPFAVAFCVGFYLIRMFAITGIYHRYFAHKSYKTNRFWQLQFALLGASCAQRGPLWWAANHRKHHRYSDTEKDIHSPVRRGFWWSHVGWITSDISYKTPYEYIKDFAKYPELRWLNRYDITVPIAVGTVIFFLGVLLEKYAPGLGTTGGQLLVWGMFVSTVFLFHGTVSINSLTHIFGKKRFDTYDNSRNNFWLSVITLGEGWHNNHHRYPSSVRQGFYWWEIDVTYYVLRFLSYLGIIWDLKPVPKKIYAEAENNRAKGGVPIRSYYD